MKARLRTKLLVLLCLFTCLGKPARGDLFGGDVVVLSQILIQAIQQLVRLQQILGAAHDHISLLRQLNQGISDSLQILRRIHPNLDPGIYRDWEFAGLAQSKLEEVYGKVPESPEARVQQDTDRGVAEAVAFNNGFYRYSQELDGIGERIQQQSHFASPVGAARLTAQAAGLIVQVLNQNLRAQSTLLKLQAQDMAVRNRKEKAATEDFLKSGRALKGAMKSEPVRFDVPRF